MTKNEERNKRKRFKLVKDMKEELNRNDKLLKRNKENPRVSVQVSLKRDHGYGGSMMYDDALDKLSLDIQKTELELKTKFEVINPIFRFQDNPEWRAIQITQAERDLKEYEENFQELTKQVTKVKEGISKQEAFIVDRKKQILELFEKWDVDSNS